MKKTIYLLTLLGVAWYKNTFIFTNIPGKRCPALDLIHLKKERMENGKELELRWELVVKIIL